MKVSCKASPTASTASRTIFGNIQLELLHGNGQLKRYNLTDVIQVFKYIIIFKSVHFIFVTIFLSVLLPMTTPRAVLRNIMFRINFTAYRCHLQ